MTRYCILILYYKINNSTVTHSSSLSVNDAMPNNICAHSVMHVSWLGRIYYLDGLRLLILMWIRKFQCHLDCIPLHNDGWFLCNDCHSSHWQSVAKTFFILWCSEFGGKEAVYSKTDYFIPFFSHVIKYAYIILTSVIKWLLLDSSKRSGLTWSTFETIVFKNFKNQQPQILN